jgi:predicted amidohydrolase
MRLAAAAYPIDWHTRWNESVGKLRVWVRTASEGGAGLMLFPEFAALELASLADEENAKDPERATEAVTARIKDVDELHASLAREFDALIGAATGPLRLPDGSTVHRLRLFAPDGSRGFADQEAPDAAGRDVWGLQASGTGRVFETPAGRIGALIGADVEAPGLAAALAAAGAGIILAPARAGAPEAADRLRQAALARAAETGCVVVQSVAIGEADWAPAIARSTGSAGVYVAPGAEGSEDGVLAVGKADTPGWVYADVADDKARGGSAPDDDAAEWPVEIVALE